jgi:hypothetical protein
MAVPIADGTHIAKVTKAEERLSANGNEMLVLQLTLPDGRTLPCCLTFVDKAHVAINAFCDSANLLRPAEKDLQAELTAGDCLGRYLYISVVNDVTDAESDPFPRITRFLTREAALLKNPTLAKVLLREQPPRTLKTV